MLKTHLALSLNIDTEQRDHGDSLPLAASALPDNVHSTKQCQGELLAMASPKNKSLSRGFQVKIQELNLFLYRTWIISFVNGRKMLPMY